MADPDDLDRRDAGTAAEQMRLDRARLVGEVASGAVTLDGLFAEQAATGRCDTIKVVVLAEKVPGVGKVRARRAMEKVGIAEDARWGEIDPLLLRTLWAAMADAATRPL
jgi:hypothetical protein